MSDCSKEMARCDNCDKVFEVPMEKDWTTIPNLFERIEPGGEIPWCECPDCGSLAYLVEDDKP